MDKKNDLSISHYELLKLEIHHLSDKINVVYWMMGIQFMFIAGIITYMLTTK